MYWPFEMFSNIKKEPTVCLRIGSDVSNNYRALECIFLSFSCPSFAHPPCSLLHSFPASPISLIILQAKVLSSNSRRRGDVEDFIVPQEEICVCVYMWHVPFSGGQFVCFLTMYMY